MNKKYKSSIILGLFMAVIGLGLVFKTQVSNSPFENVSKNDRPLKSPLLTLSKGIDERLETAKKTSLEQHDVAGEIPVIKNIKSLKGTQIHGNLRIDDNGNLIVEKPVKQLFDYFLNVSGEVPRAELIMQIKQGIADYLTEPAQSQALKLFDDYLVYQAALQTEINSGLYQVTPGNLDDLEASYQTRSQLRSFHLGNEAASAFFGDEEARDWYTVGKLRLNANTSLSDAERQAELSALESTLPENHKKVMYKQREREAIRTKIDDLRTNNADIYTLQEEWSKHYDNETVERFVNLETTRNEWNNRYQAYLQKKERMSVNFASKEAYNQALDQLKSSMFKENEILRVNAKDRLAQN
ncbi:lipase secretion chaperone [Alkalimarinus alittae]|uniref:Lipase chaperone n=1 Tax=Alkalimarinus alittae TaxID=2961619 RepID=A0ABY6MZV7_9ALTE|nr:lipase secretion chaperone [Alkalimarinus alittae]UZE95369.1 hypothetical protein NKI27_15040 [Alkalimarinus alittae]